MMREETNASKAEWDSPELVVYGSVEELTLQPKSKHPGFSDDFGVSGVSDSAP